MRRSLPPDRSKRQRLYQYPAGPTANAVNAYQTATNPAGGNSPATDPRGSRSTRQNSAPHINVKNSTRRAAALGDERLAA
jgi:hypothetical protein